MGGNSILRAVIVVASLALTTAGIAQAGPSMATGGLTSQPIGHYEFCKLNAKLCAIRTPDRGPEVMTREAWDMVLAVNAAVNTAVKPMSDLEIYGKTEVWAFPTEGVGDCEDYVLEKQRQLSEGGISISNLLITVLRKQDSEGHAVLTLRTDAGDYILDNLNDQVVEWNDTDYRYLKRQSSIDTGRWVSIRGGQTPTVSSVDRTP